MKDKLQAAGYDVASTELYTLAQSLLQRHSLNPRKVVNLFVAELSADKTFALMGYSTVHQEALRYLEARVEDMRGTKLRSEGLKPGASAGRSILADASQPSREQGGQTLSAPIGQRPRAAPAREASREPSRSNLAASATVAKTCAQVVKLTISQRYRFGDGRCVVQVRLSELLHYATVGQRDAFIAQQIYERCRGYDQNLTVKQAVQDLPWLDKLIERAEKDHRYVPG